MKIDSSKIAKLIVVVLTSSLLVFGCYQVKKNIVPIMDDMAHTDSTLILPDSTFQVDSILTK